MLCHFSKVPQLCVETFGTLRGEGINPPLFFVAVKSKKVLSLHKIGFSLQGPISKTLLITYKHF